MSDLDATRSQGQTAAPISAIATAKLRQLSPGALALAESSGLVDAFAEVFARIATATTEIQPQGPVDDSTAKPIDAGEQKTRSDQGDSSQSEANQTAPEAQVKADVGVEVELEIDTEQVTIDVEDGITLSEDVEIETSGPQFDHDDEVEWVADVDRSPKVDLFNTQKVEVAAAQVAETENVEPEAKVAEVIVPEVKPEEDHHRRRERKSSTAIEPLKNAEEGRHRSQHAADDEPVQTATQTTDEPAQKPLENTDSIDPGRSSRRLRGRPRYDRDTNDPASRAASQDATRPQQPIASSTAAEAGANSAARSFERSSPAPTSKADSAVVTVNNVVSRIQQSGSTGGTQGTRGSTQAIESNSPSKAPSQPKTKSSEKQGNNAETVSRIKLIQRVSKAFQHLGPEGGVVRLRLAPPEMGSLRVEMRIHQRKIHGRVVAESEAASASLREHLPDLRARLESFGMQVERLEIETDTQDRHQESPFDADPRQQQHQQQQQRQREDRRWAGSALTVKAREDVSQSVSRVTIQSPYEGISSGVDLRL